MMPLNIGFLTLALLTIFEPSLAKPVPGNALTVDDCKSSGETVTVTQTLRETGQVTVTKLLPPSESTSQLITPVQPTIITTIIPSSVITTSFPASIQTITLPGPDIIVTETLPPTIETSIIPGSTIILTETEHLSTSTIPCSTLTFNQSGSIITSTYPVSTTTLTHTSVIQTSIYSASTITITHTGRTLTVTRSGGIVTSTVPGSILTSTIPGTIQTMTVSHTDPGTTTPPSPTCQYDSCLKQMLQSSEVTSFCATYTAKVHTAPIELPGCVSECDVVPGALSSACSCLVGSFTPPPVLPTSTSSSSPIDLVLTTTTPNPSLLPRPSVSETTLITYSLIPPAQTTKPALNITASGFSIPLSASGTILLSQAPYPMNQTCSSPAIVYSTLTSTTTRIVTLTGRPSQPPTNESVSFSGNSSSPAITTPCPESEMTSTSTPISTSTPASTSSLTSSSQVTTSLKATW